MALICLVVFSVFTLSACQVLLPGNDCKSDYYIQEYHVHEDLRGTSTSENSEPSALIPDNIRYSQEISLLQRELIEEKKLRQKDIHLLLRIVDKLLRRKGKEDADDNDVTVSDDEESSDGDLQRDWIESTKKYRNVGESYDKDNRQDRNNKRGKKNRGKNHQDQSEQQPISDEGMDLPTTLPTTSSGPRNDALKDTPHRFDDIMKVITNLQKEVMTVRSSQVQLYRAYKRVTFAYKRSTMLFKKTMEGHKRLQLFQANEVTQLSNDTDEWQARTHHLEEKVTCLIKANPSAQRCEKDSEIRRVVKSKRIRDVSEQVDAPHTSELHEQRQGLLAEALGDENDLTLEDDVDNDFKTDVLLERKSLYKRDTSSVDTEFEMGNLDDETELSPEVIASDKVTSLSVQRLWNVLISAGKRVATWAKKNDKEQGFLSDCSGEPQSKWTQRSLARVGLKQLPAIHCEGEWLLIQENVESSVAAAAAAATISPVVGSLQHERYDSFEDGIHTNSFFWIGNEYLSLLTSKYDYSLKIAMQTNGQNLTIEYKNFKVERKNNYYRLDLGDTKYGNGILGKASFNPVTGYDFIVPILPVSLPIKDETGGPYKTARGWWYPRSQSKANLGCYTHLNAEHPYYCTEHGNAIRVDATRMLIHRN